MKLSKALPFGVLILGVAGFVTSMSYAISAYHSQDAAQTDLPRIKISAGKYLLDAQVASTPAQHSIGLMHRASLPENEAMLFVFKHPSQQCFWMKNTHVPLTAAFLADDGTIINLADMTPLSTVMHCANRPVRYVLEMNQKLVKDGIFAGAIVGGIPVL